jgi:hypothetical protein
MKLLQFAAAIAAGAILSCTAHAAVYSVSGAMTGYEPIYPWVPPGFYTVSFDPVNPTFTGTWSIGLTDPTLFGSMTVEPYWRHTKITDLSTTPTTVIGAVDSFWPNDQHTINGDSAVVAYDSITRMFSVTQALVTIDGTMENCTATGHMVCDAPGVAYDFESSLAVQLVFDPTLQTFTGTAVNTRTFASGFIDYTSWSFGGTEVPLPAAGWLFGAALLGLSGARKRLMPGA